MESLVRSLHLAPSGNNLPSREFIVITSKETLRALTPTTPYMKWLEQAAGAVVIIADPKVSKYWLQDASIAGAFLWLAVVSEGLGAAWGAVYHSEDEAESIRREQFVRERLAIPDTYRVVAILGFGYPAVIAPESFDPAGAGRASGAIRRAPAVRIVSGTYWIFKLSGSRITMRLRSASTMRSFANWFSRRLTDSRVDPTALANS